MECDTEGVEYHISIIDSNIGVTENGYIATPTSYTVKAYASKEGYADSEEVTTTIKAAELSKDVNGDGAVDTQDVLEIYQYMQQQVKERK